MIDNGEYPNTKKGRKDAAGHCHSLYDSHKKKQRNTTHKAMVDAGYVQVQFNNIVGVPELFRYDEDSMKANEIKVEEIDNKKYDTVDLIAAMGDMFYNYGVFVSKEILKKVATKWNSTIHDISHMATAYPAGFSTTENIEFVVGYHKKAKYDEQLGGVRMKAYINQGSPKYQAWRSYVDICKASGRTPNTSMFGWAKYGMMDVSELPKGVKVPPDAKDSQGNVIYMKDFVPTAVTTCLQGKCDEKDGCGINTKNTTCDSWNCNLEDSPEGENKTNASKKKARNKNKFKIIVK